MLQKKVSHLRKQDPNYKPGGSRTGALARAVFKQETTITAATATIAATIAKVVAQIRICCRK